MTNSFMFTHLFSSMKKVTSQSNFAQFFLILTAFILSNFEAQAQQIAQLNNRWKAENIGLVNGQPISSTSATDSWVIEKTGEGDFVRLKHSGSGSYLHNQNGKLEAGAIQPGWWSAQWTLKAVDGHVHIINRWKNTYIHNQNGFLELGALGAPGWWSAQWALKSQVVKSKENANNNNEIAETDDCFGAESQGSFSQCFGTPKDNDPQPGKFAPGQVIGVGFVNKDFTANQRLWIEKIAKEWSKYGNITFDFKSTKPLIRIAKGKGHWSYYPDDIKPNLSGTYTTMSLDYGNRSKLDDNFRSTVLHEFGHSLGFIHEHSQANTNIPYNVPLLMCVYKKSQGWTEDNIRFQVLTKYAKSQSNYDIPDAKSIMLYSVDNALTVGDFEIPWNGVLSEKDKATVAAWYPFTSPVTLPASKMDYQVSIKTSSEANAPSDTDYYLTIHGTAGSIKDLHINSQITGDAFRSGEIDAFVLRGQPNVGEILGIILTSADPNIDNWKPEFIKITAGKDAFNFPINEWVNTTSKNKLYEPGAGTENTYAVQVNTADITEGGTDANIFLKIFGDKGSSAPIRLNGLKSGNIFERGDRDLFAVDNDDLGNLTKIEIYHDNLYASAGWKLNNIEISRGGKTYNFVANQWLIGTSDENKLTLLANAPGVDYTVVVKTGQLNGAGTDANIYLKINGTSGSTEFFRLNNYVAGNGFELGNEHTIGLRTTNVGNITSLTIKRDNKYAAPDWNLSNITITKGNVTKFFPYDAWVAADTEIPINAGEQPIEYIVSVQTGDIADAGTDANIFLTINGTKGSTAEERINGLVSGNGFERGDINKVTLKLKDVGDITSINIRHDNQYAAAGWYLDNVRIAKGSVVGKQYFFDAKKWLQGSDLSASLTPGEPKKDYAITIKTMDQAGAGTDSNIFITLIGSKGNSGEIRANGLLSGNAFERNSTDKFTLSAVKDIGVISQVKIRSDGAYAGAGWDLGTVTVVEANANPVVFTCNCTINEGEKVINK